MALSPFQRTICKLIAANRIEQGESYVAGGAALNEFAGASRISRDIDLFHDTETALRDTWHADKVSLEQDGYEIRVKRNESSYVEAVVIKNDESVALQWTRDSAYRFFPLIAHDEFGLALHPFDLATNKVLALVGRLEVRDWIDLMTCHDRIQRFGYLAWAAPGKDPGLGPLFILEQAGRSARYTHHDMEKMQFDGPPPDIATLSRGWHAMRNEAIEIVKTLPPRHAGKCVLDHSGKLYTETLEQLKKDLASDQVFFHEGAIRGAYPQIISA